MDSNQLLIEHLHRKNNKNIIFEKNILKYGFIVGLLDLIYLFYLGFTTNFQILSLFALPIIIPLSTWVNVYYKKIESIIGIIYLHLIIAFFICFSYGYSYLYLNSNSHSLQFYITFTILIIISWMSIKSYKTSKSIGISGNEINQSNNIYKNFKWWRW